MNSLLYGCVIIGAGASGLFCAAKILSQRPDISVLLIDGNARCGKKLMLTGGGRCNISNSEIDTGRYNTDSPEALTEAISKYGSSDTIEFFENTLGVNTVLDGKLYYPATYRAGTVLDCLRFYLEDKGCEMLLDAKVTSLRKIAKAYEIETDTQMLIHAERVVIATGGISYPRTGSTGDSIYLLKDFLEPGEYIDYQFALTSLTCTDKSIKSLAGTRVHCEVECNGKTSKGELLFSKEGGISGICVFDISGEAIRLLKGGEKPKVKINLLETEPGDAVIMLAVRAKMFPERNITSAFAGVIQRTILEYVLKKTGISAQSRAGDLSHDDLCVIAEALTGFEVEINGHGGPSDAQVSQGGVLLKSLDSNMRLKSTGGVYVIGEAVNCDGPCGGYNLQWAWTSAALAADDIAGVEYV